MPAQGYGQVPGSAGGYGRGQNAPAAGWAGNNSGNFNNGFGGYQG